MFFHLVEIKLNDKCCNYVKFKMYQVWVWVFQKVCYLRGEQPENCLKSLALSKKLLKKIISFNISLEKMIGIASVNK